ncbi:hypothetical protein C5O26_19215, partial [Bacillus velezensis]
LIDMLKFSGYSYLIRGQPWVSGGFYGRRPRHSAARLSTTLGVDSEPATGFRGLRSDAGPQRKPGGLMVEMTLGQACPPEYW